MNNGTWDNVGSMGDKDWQLGKIAPPRPITEQEMAEWLAVTVLEYRLELFPGCETAKQWHRKGEHICYEGELDEFLNSPDGFFAVWDAFEKIWGGDDKDLGRSITISYTYADDGNGYEYYIGQFYGKGKDRYEAFYNAVYEAWKK